MGHRLLQSSLISRSLGVRTEVVLMIIAARLVLVMMALLLSRGEDVLAQVRNYIGDTSQCPACGSDFRTRARLIRHLLDTLGLRLDTFWARRGYFRTPFGQFWVTFGHLLGTWGLLYDTFWTL